MPRRTSFLLAALRRSTEAVLLLGVFPIYFFHLPAQSYPLAVPDGAISNAQVLHARNWLTTLGLPDPSITRSNAGERWYLIETGRGQFSPTFGNLFAPDTGWVDIAKAHHTDLIYTFTAAPAWTAHSANNDPVNRAPYDIDDKDETCMTPIAGKLSSDGDCIWKEWITALMQKNCDVTAQPNHPLTGRCHIRYFETWNEFNAENFWQDTLAHLAKMSNDMAIIVRAYCGDCKIIGGSTSAGGIGRSGDGPSGSGRFDVALGEFLDAWHAIPHASLPDIVSFHAYPSRTNVSYPPFPETNISVNDPKCTEATVPDVFCYIPIVDQPAAIRRILAERPYLPTTTPIWNTESGWNGNRTLLHGVNSDGYADMATGYLRQAFLARETILLANQGIPVNIWYEADHQCDGTLFGFGLPASSNDMWQCRNDPVIPHGLTPAGIALNTLYSWLHDATFTGPCKSSGFVWWCPLRGPSIGDAMLAWTTSWKRAESATVLPVTFKYAHVLDGSEAQLKAHEPPLLEMRPRLFNNTR